jgi:hypothetical protein
MEPQNMAMINLKVIFQRLESHKDWGSLLNSTGCNILLSLKLDPKHQPQEAMALFREAFKVTPALQEVLQWVAKAESPPVRWDELPSSMSCRFDG